MIVIATNAEDLSGKPRPFLVAQSDLFNEGHATITACPMTGVVGGEALFRVAFAPTTGTGLLAESEVQVDKIQMMHRDQILRGIGRASAIAMEQVDQALRRWLGL